VTDYQRFEMHLKEDFPAIAWRYFGVISTKRGENPISDSTKKGEGR
jgi:hypothetical protein